MRTMITLECAFCGASFERREAYVRHREKTVPGCQYFCGLACAASKPKQMVNCATCGKVVELLPSHKKSKSGNYFCNKSCAAKTNNSIYKRGENHPNYTDGHSAYRERQLGNRCEDCGETRYYLLLVHHINKDRKQNDQKNLVTLCHNCHVMRHLVVKDGRLGIHWGTLTTDEAKKMLKQKMQPLLPF